MDTHIEGSTISTWVEASGRVDQLDRSWSSKGREGEQQWVWELRKGFLVEESK